VLLSRNPDLCAAELDGEMCLFNPESAEYLNLNATGSSIWTLLENPSALEDLISGLQERYVVDQATCRLETERFVEEALQKGMLQVNQQE
jgi:hypothetical protein